MDHFLGDWLALLTIGHVLTCQIKEEKGYYKLVGVDYSSRAIELCERISSETAGGPGKTTFMVHWFINEDNCLCPLDLQRADITSSELCPSLLDRFDVIIDKGTWDAISLSENREEALKGYRSNLKRLFRCRENSDKGHPAYFIIVSCNFTRSDSNNSNSDAGNVGILGMS